MNSIEMVQKRPGMYVGDTADGSGVHTMLFEVINNAINESLEGHCKLIDITINKDGSATVSDDGRGIPIDTLPNYGIAAAEILLTHLHTAPIQDVTHDNSKRLQGIGLCVVNALSDVLELQTVRAGKKYFLRYRLGRPQAALALAEYPPDSPKPLSGTAIRFLPSQSFFVNPTFVFSNIVEHLTTLKFLASGAAVSITDLRDDKARHFDIHL